MEYVISLLEERKRYLRVRLNQAELINYDEATKELLTQIAEISRAIQILRSENKP